MHYSFEELYSFASRISADLFVQREEHQGKSTFSS